MIMTTTTHKRIETPKPGKSNTSVALFTRLADCQWLVTNTIGTTTQHSDRPNLEQACLMEEQASFTQAKDMLFMMSLLITNLGLQNCDQP